MREEAVSAEPEEETEAMPSQEMLDMRRDKMYRNFVMVGKKTDKMERLL